MKREKISHKFLLVGQEFKEPGDMENTLEKWKN